MTPEFSNDDVMNDNEEVIEFAKIIAGDLVNRARQLMEAKEEKFNPTLFFGAVSAALFEVIAGMSRPEHLMETSTGTLAAIPYTWGQMTKQLAADEDNMTLLTDADGDEFLKLSDVLQHMNRVRMGGYDA